MIHHFATRCVHGERKLIDSHPFGAIGTPIYQSATFAHPGVGQSTGYDYSRDRNPTRHELEEVMASLEGAADALACSSGMAAVSLILALFEQGDEIICTEDLYGGSVRLFATVGRKQGVSFRYCDTAKPELLQKQITRATKALYIETPSNPTMLVSDLREMKRIAREHDLLLIVDNTFLTPYLQQPIALGADLVVHSGTKFLAGHNDTLAGFVCAAEETLAEKLRFLYKTTGSCLSPFDSFLVLRGIKTLPLRLRQQQENAMKIAQWLTERPEVEKVFYIGLPDFPGYQVNTSQAKGAGSMISAELKSRELVLKLLERVKVFTYAESLGGVESLITYPMLQTHADVPASLRERLGINDRFIRLSVGIEHAEDLLEDLKDAFVAG